MSSAKNKRAGIYLVLTYFYSFATIKAAHMPQEIRLPHIIKAGLKVIRQCPVCKHSLTANSMSIIESEEGTHLLHILCPKCISAMLAVVATNQFGMSAIAMSTDLSVNDVEKVYKGRSISENELLNFHSLLAKPGILEKLVLEK